MCLTPVIAAIAGLARKASTARCRGCFGYFLSRSPCCAWLGAALQAIAGGRQARQWAIGTAALGLYFTPAVLALLSANLLLVSVIAGGALVVGLLCAALLTAALTSEDRPTAFFCLAARRCLRDGGGRRALRRCGRPSPPPMPLRVMLVVAVVPFGLSWSAPMAATTTWPLATVVVPSLLPLWSPPAWAAWRCSWLFADRQCLVLGPLLIAGLTNFGMNLSALLAGW